MSFNLIDEPWLPCVRPDGTSNDLSLRQAFAGAHEHAELRDASPLVTVALHRLLLAVLHRTVKPANLSKDWRSLWDAGCFDMGRLNTYFEEHREGFDLFHPQRPFFQDASLQTKDPSPVTRLAKERASGNNATLFDHSTEAGNHTLAPALAARLVVAEQVFAVGGGKSERGYTTSGPMVGGVGVLALGRTLFQTLMLNLVPQDKPKAHERDNAAWEHAPRWEPSEWCGIAELFTWQSRALRLRHEDGVVVAVDYAQGRKLDPPKGSYEPMMPYRRDEKKGDLPLRLNPEKALWRDSSALLRSSNADQAWQPSLTIHNLSRLQDEGFLPADVQLELAAFGLCNDKARIDLWRFERFPLPVAYLRDQELKADLDSLLELAEEVGKAVRTGGWAAASEALTSPEGNAPPRERIEPAYEAIAPDRLFWAALEVPFRRLLDGLPGDEAHRRSRRRKWFLETLRPAAEEAFRVAAAKLDEQGINYRAYAKGEAILRARLRKLAKVLPEDPNSPKEESADG